MKSCYLIASLLLSALVFPLPLQAANHYEELVQKLLSHLPEQSSPMRLGVVNFSFPEDRKGLSDAEDVKDEMEVALGNDKRVKLISRTALHALEQEWNFQEGDLANPETKAVLSKVEGIDALVRGKVSLRENGEICIFAELMQVSNGAIMAKEKVSWMPAAAQPAPAPSQPSYQPAPQPQPTYQPAPQPVYQPAPVQYTSTENRSDLQPLLNRMAALKCKHASSAEQQRHLLQLLPLIRDGASVDIVASDDPYQRTALHYSCAIGSLGITRWLVNHGANVNAADANGRTPLSMVGADNRTAITNLLVQNGASYNGGGSSYTPAPAGGEPTDPKEQCDLGYKYQYGKDGLPQSYDKAFYWYKKAADQGLPVAQNNLGFCYHNGWGCSKNLSMAFYYYTLAAEAGVPLGQSNLGTCYEFGWGTAKDMGKAIEWYRRGARQGNPSAQKHLKRHGLSW